MSYLLAREIFLDSQKFFQGQSYKDFCSFYIKLYKFALSVYEPKTNTNMYNFKYLFNSIVFLSFVLYFCIVKSNINTISPTLARL